MGDEAASPWGLSDDEAEGPPGPPPLPGGGAPPRGSGVQPDADAPAASRGRRRQRDDENIAYIEVAGGFLVYDLRQSILSAHCMLREHQNPKNPCRVRRTCLPGPPGHHGQGRPCGFLMAWLADAGRHATRASHGIAALRRNDADRAALSHERRSAGRADLVAAASPALDFERPQRDGEPEEPLQIP